MTISSAMDVRRAGDRFATRLPWLDSHHSSSFSRHSCPANSHDGLLLVDKGAAIAIRRDGAEVLIREMA